MKRLGYLCLLLVLALGCDKQKNKVKNPDGGKKNGELKVPTDDPLWGQLETLTKEPGAAKDGVCQSLTYLANNEKGRKLLASCVDPIISEPKENADLRRGFMDLLLTANATDGVETLKKATTDSKAEIRGKAAETLLRLKDLSGADALIAYKGGYNSDHGGVFWLVQNISLLPADFAIKAAASEDDTTRKNAAILLGLVGGDEALAMVSDLAIDPDKDIQAYARKVNYKLSDAKGLLEELQKDLKSKNKTTRFIAVEMLGYYGRAIGEEDVRALLGAALNDADGVVQIKAVESLVLLGGPESNALLVAKLATAENTLAGRILLALTELKDPSKIDDVLVYAEKADVNSRGTDLSNLFIAYADKKAAPYAQKLLASNLVHIRRAGVKMLAAFGTDEATWKPLIEDPEPEIKGLAMIAAVKSGGKADTFKESLKDPNPLVNAYAHVATLLSKSK